MNSFLLSIMMGLTLTFVSVQSKANSQNSNQSTLCPSTSNECTQAAEKAASKYKACVSVGYTEESCFKGTFFKPKPKNCGSWSNACFESCKNANGEEQFCFKYCYK